MRADLNVIDLAKMKMCKPYLAQDLPLGQQRWMQTVEGYCMTLVAGVPTFKQGVATGALPGTLLRNPRRIESAYRGVARSVSGPFESGLPLPEDANSKERALEGTGRAGASAAARLLRDVVETPGVQASATTPAPQQSR